VRLPIIETTRLTKRYGRRGGIEAVDLSVSEGQICGFLGPNGSGKTTAIRVLVGLLRPGSGVARVFGLDCWRQSPQVKRHVGYLPGDLRLYSWMTGRTPLPSSAGFAAGTLPYLPRRLRSDSLCRCSSVCGLCPAVRARSWACPGPGHEPRLMILDEPTTGLDPPMRSALAAYLRERSAVGDTVFFSSHTLGEVEQLCDRVSILRSGVSWPTNLWRRCAIAPSELSRSSSAAPRRHKRSGRPHFLQLFSAMAPIGSASW